MAIPSKNVLGNPNVTEGNFQIAIEQLRESVIGSGKTYNSANTYMAYDICYYNGVVYYSKINNNIGNTPSIGANWGDYTDLLLGVVHKTGDETISGVKTFSNKTVMNGTVGIGIQNPVETVDVIGNIRASIVYGSRSSAAAVPSGGLGVAIDGALQCEIVSPSYLTMAVLTGGYERMRIDSSGNVLVTGSGGLGYGTGAGGTVTQLTSKSTAVTLNKLTGAIIMNNESLSPNTKVSFFFYNSNISLNDAIVLNVFAGSTVLAQYEVRGRCAEGVSEIVVYHTYVAELSDSISLKFIIIKGANS